MRLLRLTSCVCAVLLSLGFMAPALAQDSLEQGFKTPPDSAKPRTWWHWTMSNVTKDGITKDLEWMKRVGIGGFMLADVNVGRGQSVEPKIPYGTPEWFDAVRHAAGEADRLGLEMAIFSSPGWSETGGPWVKPEEAMKKLVWSEIPVEGPQRFSGKLPQPASNNGQIRNTGATYYAGSGGDPTYYGDSAVLAYRSPDDERDAAAAKPIVTTNNGPVDGTPLLDDQLNTLLTIPAPADGGPAWVQFEFPEPFAARAITLGGRGGSANGIPVGRVLASDDGITFRTLVTLPGSQLYRQSMVRTYAFPPTRAKFYRIEMTGAPLGPAATMSQAAAYPAKQYILSEAVLHSGARVHRWEEKAGFSFLFEYESVPTPGVPSAETIKAQDVVDLTSRMKPDGSIEWDAPPGKWTILRLGYSLTGAKNRPATAAGSGFEADKLSREHMEAYIRGYFDPLQKALGPLFGRSLRYVMMDSWEAGTNNWTDRMLPEFVRRRGYDPRPYLPALTGRIVESADVSDRFLWDFRRTLADMWADQHYGTMAEELRKRGLGIYAEASGVSLEMPEDTLLNKSKVEIPMGEFWVRDLHPRLMYFQDVRGAASAAHVYGKHIVAAESFTGGGFEAPFTLKKVADYWFAQGVNRIVFHTSAHQPLDTKPGNMMVGTHLHRNITWAEEAAPFVTYLARNSFMLQQGKPVADLCYLLNEGAPSTPPIWGAGTLPVPPAGYDYDFINADVLLNRLGLDQNGRLTLPDGSSSGYRVLVLPQTHAMRPELVRKLRDLVLGGAIVVGPKPTHSPSLMHYPKADEKVRALAEEIWGDLDGVSRTIRHVGKGVVIWGWPLDRVMEMQGIEKDFESSRALDTDLAWAHRRNDDADIYYVANLGERAQNFEMRCRVAGREAEAFRPMTGTIEPLSYRIDDDRTTVEIPMEGHEAAFIVFRRTASETSRSIPALTTETLETIDGPWKINFPAGLGAPASAEFSELHSWTLEPDDGLKYFSGTAVYTKTFEVKSEWLKPGAGAQILLDLGRVGDVANVSVNDREIDVVWAPPYRVDVSHALRPGENRLTIRVTNEWTNRIAGDRALPAEKQVLHLPPATGPAARLVEASANALPESGLLGPVKLVRESRQ
ncbi:MAG TPA: glycosyl hydrolase [Opitutaceae bacterium]|nr:glycosyl hydrolase [Opitutaceae bacterium]